MLAAALCAGASMAATWTGTAGDGQWTTGANWEGNTPPGAGDDAVFTASATLAAPTDFTGTVRVQGEGTHLTFDVAAAAALAVVERKQRQRRREQKTEKVIQTVQCVRSSSSTDPL